MNEHEGHWTDDDDRIERYVLNKLGAEERNELEDHLRVCEVCKRAVRTERLLIAGIQREGREQFKSELKKKIVVFPEKKTPWVQILSAAAIMVILITLGIFHRWFETQTLQTNDAVPHTSPQTEIKEAEHQPDRQIAQQQSSSKDEMVQPAPAIAAQRVQLTPTQRTENTDKLLPDKTDAPSQKKIAVESRETGGAVTNMQSQDYLASQPTLEQPRTETTSIAENESPGFWIEGTILQTATTVSGDVSTSMQNRAGQGSAYSLQKSERDAADRAGQSTTKQNPSYSWVTVNQLKLSDLPSTLQRLQKPDNSAKVLTRIEQVGNRMALTLYLDSLVVQSDLANASIQTLHDDSIIVKLPNRRIAYKLPAGWNAQQQAKPTK